MEYKQKKEQILTNVQFTNLLSFNLVQNKLQRNFRSIVQALLLCQNKADHAVGKTQNLEECLAHQKQRHNLEQKEIREAVSKLNEKLKILEHQINNQPLPTNTPISSTGLQSLKDIKGANNRSEFSKKSIHSIQQPSEKNLVCDKKLNDLVSDISGLKDRMPNLQLMESQFEKLKRDLALVKGQLLASGNKSAKNLVRQSITIPFKQNILKRSSNGNLPSQNSLTILNNISNRQLKVAEEVKQQSNTLETQLEGLHVQVNTLNLCFEEIKNYVEDLRKKDFKYNSLLNQLDAKFKKMQEQTRRDAENFEKQIKNISHQSVNQNINTQSLPKQPSNRGHKDRTSQQSPITSNEQSNINFKNQLNDKLSKIQGSLVNFVTESEFNRFKGQTRQKMDQIQKNHNKLVCQYQQEIKKIYDMFINKDIDLNRLGQSIGLANETIKENHLQAQRKNNITIAKIDQLKKHLQNLREDVQYYQTINAQNLKKTQAKRESTQNGQNNQSKDKTSSTSDPKALDQLKKYFNSKLHEQRAYLVGLIRDIEKRLQSANGVNQQVANMWDKINQINVFLTKKADGQDIKKNLVYLEKKINKIGSYLSKSDQNTDDARIAKTNWFCLSCDKSLLGYKGKVGKHLVWDTMPVKGMVKVESKKGLPSLKK